MRRMYHQNTLYRMVYASRRTDPAGPDGFAAAAKLHNEAAEITAALLFTDESYAQVLEGTRDAVERAFERIARDPRHDDVTVASFVPTERRRFADQALLLLPAEPDAYRFLFAGLRADPALDRPRLTTGSDILHVVEQLALPMAGAPM